MARCVISYCCLSTLVPGPRPRVSPVQAFSTRPAAPRRHVGSPRSANSASTTPRYGQLGKLREQCAAVQPRRLERAHSRASAARPVCARPCSAAAVVFDDDLTLTSAASSSIAPSPLSLFHSPALISQLRSLPRICDLCALGRRSDVCVRMCVTL